MMTLSAAAQVTGGELIDGDADFEGVCTDSRSVGAGALFIALKGEHFDGHDYVAAALQAGAAAALVEASWVEAHRVQGLPLLAVTDTRLALGELAASWRGRFELPLIGVTGSNGKTTVKEMCAAILREQARADGLDPAGAVLATEGNFNNDIGMPLMLLKLNAGHRAAVIEMGMNHPGEIDYLTDIARPTVAIVTNAQRAHLAGLGSIKAVALAKGEIFSGLSADGVAVINGDDAHAALWRELAGAHRVIGFSVEGAADAVVTAQVTPLAFGSRLQLATPAGAAAVALPLPGRHNAANALAATAACLAAGADLAAVVAGLSAYTGAKGRLQRLQAENGATLIDDSYNANPDSMRAAIDVLAALPGKKILVLGDMGEVGPAAAQFHDEVGGYAKSMGIDRLLAVGELTATAVRNFDGGASHFKNVTALIEVLRGLLDANTTVLVKGSRFMKMERVVHAIAVQEGESDVA
ncbi:MAG TPA: UDP-N-acetylmuramoyl-tripeptide--D-alanyl-D-alanine ligase [Rhodocyclaceae bacterium]|nr:UDP-N-acetylmuramoyl-tripeptide--D-alanyl-D-alanine ligase [Rhodocyclaceae bacterium]